jgi:Domain of unknown function (DUF5916)
MMQNISSIKLHKNRVAARYGSSQFCEMKKAIPLIILYHFLATGSEAQSIFTPPTKAQRLTIEAVRAQEKIIIDGRLDEAAWSQCKATKHFIQSQPDQGKAASYDTEVKVLYDDKYIYIGAICYTAGTKLMVQDLRRDFLYSNNELFGVFIDPFQDVQNPIPSFLTTPYSTLRDLLIYDDRIYDLNWDAVWEAKSSIKDSSWETEIAIPWSTIRYPSDSTTWGINFNRNIRSLNEVTGWSPWPYAYTVGRMSYEGLVTNLRPPASKANVQLLPYILTNASKNAPDPKTILSPQIGGEIKWLPNTNTSLEGTVNTDFAQADVDQQVINLKRSTVFFPEKRQFFLENANLFAVGQDAILQPFFSRSIGLDSNANPLAIKSGFRLIHQDSKQAIGALFIDQQDSAGGANSYFGVIRGQQNIGTKCRVGTLITYRHDNKVNSPDNLSLSVDGFWHATEPLYIRPMVSVILPSGASKGGWAFFTDLSYLKNSIAFKLIEAVATQGYLPKTGYLERTNFIHTSPQLTITYFTHWLHNTVRFFVPTVTADIYHNASTQAFEEADLTIMPVQFITQKGTTLSFSLLPSWQNLLSVFQPVPGVNIAAGNYRYSRVDGNLATNLSAPYSLLVDINTGGYYNGRLDNYTITARLAPIPNIAMDLSYTYDGFMNFTPKSGTIKTYLVAPDIRISLNPKIQVSGIYQYNTVTNEGGLNAKFSWEYKPLSFVYLVYNSLKNIQSQVGVPLVNQQTAILKVSYIRQL